MRSTLEVAIARARRRHQRWLDLRAALLVAGVSGFVYWIVPPLPPGM